MLFSNMDEGVGKGQPANTSLVTVFSGIRNNLGRWKANFEYLVDAKGQHGIKHKEVLQSISVLCGLVRT